MLKKYWKVCAFIILVTLSFIANIIVEHTRLYNLQNAVGESFVVIAAIYVITTSFASVFLALPEVLLAASAGFMFGFFGAVFYV